MGAFVLENYIRDQQRRMQIHIANHVKLLLISKYGDKYLKISNPNDLIKYIDVNIFELCMKIVDTFKPSSITVETENGPITYKSHLTDEMVYDILSRVKGQLRKMLNNNITDENETQSE